MLLKSIFSILLSITLCQLSHAEGRTFRNTDGKEIKAEYMGMEDGGKKA